MTSPRTLLKGWNLHAKKQMGQNFLDAPNTARRIVEKTNLAADDAVLEIGPGLGALTIPVARIAATVWAVEKDSQLLPLLQTELTAARLNNAILINNDILKVNLAEIQQAAGRRLIVMGNLPYNISSQVLVQLIRNRSLVRKAVLMFQKELAERIAAPPGGKTYGRISAMLQYCARTAPLMRIEAARFFPRPKIDSEVLEIVFDDTIATPAEDEALLFTVIRVAFGKRRKTLKNALTGSALGLDAPQAERLLMAAGIDPIRRAETLHPEEFVTLSNLLAEHRQ